MASGLTLLGITPEEAEAGAPDIDTNGNWIYFFRLSDLQLPLQ